MDTSILSWIIWIPVIGMAAIALIPREKVQTIKMVTAVATGIQFLATLGLWSRFEESNGGFQFMERAEWIPSFNITYILGVDGLSLPMVILTGLLFFLGTFVSWNINRAQKGYFALYLLLNTGVMGVFLSLDFFLFYVFWCGCLVSFNGSFHGAGSTWRAKMERNRGNGADFKPFKSEMACELLHPGSIV